MQKILLLFLALVSLAAAVDRCTNSVCATEGSSLKFFLLGDWGGRNKKPFTTPAQLEVAANVGKLASLYGTHFQLLLGDNFYDYGVTDVNDPRFKETFEDVYTAPALESTPFHVIVGNHDHRGNVQAQIEYSQKSSRWSFPSEFYTFSYNITKTNTVVSFIMLDTVILVGNIRDDDDLTQPEAPANAQVADDMWLWLQEQLIALSPVSDYIFVAGHYPIYSVADHGPTNSLVQKLKPLVEKYQVNAYFCGHDHNTQHLSVTTASGTMNYVVAGASAVYSTTQSNVGKCPPNSLRYFFPKASTKHGGFVYVEADSTEAKFHYYTSNSGSGTDEYQFSTPARQLAKKKKI